MLRLLLLNALLVSAMACPPATAEPMPDHYVPALKRIFMASQAPGMVASIVAGDRTFTIGFGSTSADNSAAPNEDTLLHLNSLSKLMTGQILAASAARNLIALSDPLQRFAPVGRTLSNASITIRDLLVHTSGMARDVPQSVWRTDAPREGRWAWLEATPLRRPPGRVAEYSNAAYLFLGDALEQATHLPYASLLRRDFSAPLQLSDTTLAPTPGQCRRLLSRGRSSCPPADSTAASSGIYSTTKDMARWLRALMSARPGTVLYTTRQDLVTRHDLQALVALDFAGRADAIAWGWLRMSIAGENVLQKTGGGSDTMNYVIMSPKKQKALFITASRMDLAMLRRLTRSANKLMVELVSAP